MRHVMLSMKQHYNTGEYSRLSRVAVTAVGDGRRSPIFIVGLPRSGTSLVHQVGHPNRGTMDQAKAGLDLTNLSIWTNKASVDVVISH